MKNYSDINLPEITLKYKSGHVQKKIITCSKDTSEILRQCFDSDTLEISESFIILFLNRANSTIGWTKHSSGGSCSCTVDLKLIMTTALQSGAHSIIVSHNHPSGNLKPSTQDLTSTERLYKACKLLDLKMLDHLIITSDDYYSFSDEGDLNY